MDRLQRPSLSGPCIHLVRLIRGCLVVKEGGVVLQSTVLGGSGRNGGALVTYELSQLFQYCGEKCFFVRSRRVIGETGDKRWHLKIVTIHGIIIQCLVFSSLM